MGVLQRSTRRLLREAQLRHNDVLIPHARLFATPAVSAYRASQPSMTKISGGSSPVQLTDQPSDWTTHRNVQFSIRPSLLSPLYATYRQEQDLQATRTLTSHLITAHQILKEEHDGYDQEQVVRTARHRAAALRQLAQDLRALAPRSNLVACNDRKVMLGFYSILEQQVVGKQPAQLTGDAAVNAASATDGAQAEVMDEADVYHHMATGRLDVMETWTKYFHEKYAGVPSLESVDKIYAKKDMLKAIDALDEPITAAKGNKAAGARAGRKHGAHMDLAGTVVAEGKRKTSFAKVTLRPGPASMTINGQPYHEYFGNLALRAHAVQPLMIAPRTLGKFGVDVEVKGGGVSSQAQAVRTGLARALMLYSGEVDLYSRKDVRSLGRWDGRQVERKKPGRKKARKGFTWVKR